MRIGQGFDLHRLEPGTGVTLGGVYVECDKRIVAHSDGDVLTHAICDALLGAAALGDLGDHFPDSDERWKGADSMIMLEQVTTLLASRGFSIANVDATILAEVPRVGPHKMAIRKRLAEVLCLDVDLVSVKATTFEGVDAIGRREAIAAQAVVLLINNSSVV